MQRHLYSKLLDWKQSNRRKPLVLQGARQVGKTWLINQFGKQEYKNYIYLNFEQNSDLRSLFQGNLQPQNIIENISLYLGKKVVAKDTLICFDEIQTTPTALTSLKYFQEQAPEYHIIAAGSLLGVEVGKKSSFPVGKVNFMTLYPLSFAEYLNALGEDLIIDKLVNTTNVEPLPELIHEKLLSHLKLFLFLGGMPEVLQNYIENKDIGIVREIQNEILEAYARDFSKYTDANQTIKISEFWKSIPFQLAKENKKFKYSEVRKRARAATFAQSIDWLKNAGLIHPTYNLKVPKVPISGYADYTKFKVYLLDTGLLAAMLNLSSQIIMQPNALFSEYNGAFVENYVATELVKSIDNELFYWTSGHAAEVDFVTEIDNKIYPIEVKSGMNRNLKSLNSYADKYKPEFIFRFSPRNSIQSSNFINLSLYSVFNFRHLLHKI
jgi:predicted AAA+ superfamily ATPase